MTQAQERGDTNDRRYLYNDAVREILAGNPDESHRILRRILPCRVCRDERCVGCRNIPGYVDHLLGWHEMRDGQFRDGDRLRERGRLYGLHGQHHPIPLPRWTDGPLEGRRIALDLEGGLGDQIMYARFATMLAERGATVIVVASKNLHPLIEDIRGVSRLVDRMAMMELTAADADCWVPSMSVPHQLALEWSTLPNAPYIGAEADDAARWDDRLDTAERLMLGRSGSSPRIGLRWSGGGSYAYERLRQFDPAAFEPLSKRALVVSLHKEYAPRLPCPPWVVELSSAFESWSETAAVIANLDAVISSETSVCVLAAAMGVQTWILVPMTPTHYFMHPFRGAKTPWLCSARLVHMERPGDWGGALKVALDQVMDFITTKGG